MEKKPVINNLLEQLFDEIHKHKDLNESHLLRVLANGLSGTLDIINANLWKINSFKNSAIKKEDNDKEYVTLLGCYGYHPDPRNIKEFVHDTETGVFKTIFCEPPQPYYEISLSSNLECKTCHVAPDRVKAYDLDFLIIVPITYKNTAGYDWQYVLNLYVKPYDIKPQDMLIDYIESIKTILRFGLQNKRRYLSAELIKTVIEHFKQSRIQKNKDTASILYFLMEELKRFITFDTCSIFMWDPIYHKLALKKSLASEFSSNKPDSRSHSSKPFYFPGEGKTGKVYQTGKPLIIDDINASSKKDKFQFREKTLHELKSFMAVPIINPARPFEILGVIRLVNRLNHFNHDIVDYFSSDDYSLINDFGSLLALHLEVEQSEKIRTAFAKHMEHEITGPIISTKNDADRILDKKKNNRLETWQFTNNLEHIIETASLLESIIKNVQYTWKDSEGVPRAELYEEVTQVNFLKDILEPARNIVIPLLREHDFSPNSIVFEGGDFRIYVDKEAFIQVFVNLFSNAIKYRNTKRLSIPLVSVCCTEYDRNHPTTINVVDYGLGIAEENKERVFYFGFREIGTIQKNVRGLGIGLSVVKKIVTDFHSTIDIASHKDPTTFHISLSTKLSGMAYINDTEWKEKTK